MKSIRRTSRRAVGAVGVLFASLGIAVAAPTAAHADYVPHEQHGCPIYTICIYPAGGGWQNNKPIHWGFPPTNTHRWYNLSGMYGTHRVFNNGVYDTKYGYTAIGTLTLNTGYNGGGSHTWIQPGHFVDVRDMGPINSITLWNDYYPWSPES